MEELKPVRVKEEQAVAVESIESADASTKLDPDGLCVVCGQKVSEHTPGMLRVCGEKFRDQLQGAVNGTRPACGKHHLPEVRQGCLLALPSKISSGS